MADTLRPIKTVGIIGLGEMGLPMTKHLIAGGFGVVGFDVKPAALKAAQKLGAKVAKSPKAVAAACDLVIVVVGFDSEVLEVVLEKGGLLEGARPGTIIGVSSTVSPGCMKELASATGAERIRFVDAPLCRGAEAAQQAKLLVMGGGDKDAFEACRPAFRTFADAIFHLGPLGSGQVGKMVNNMLLWACISIDYEGLKLGEALGVNRDKLRDALLLSSGNNWALETQVINRPMPWAEKDMTIVLEEADAKRISLPLAGTLREVIKGIKIELGQPMPGKAKKRK
jgi:3-hydroxyisobutyrate dehydrogenase-like beta-hydroxyacid dehydrogenase